MYNKHVYIPMSEFGTFNDKQVVALLWLRKTFIDPRLGK